MACKGYCVKCQKETVSLHKCFECGKYVYIRSDDGSREELSKELRRGKSEIRKRYKDRRKAAKREKEKTKDDTLLLAVNAEIKADIDRYLRQGKP